VRWINVRQECVSLLFVLLLGTSVASSGCDKHAAVPFRALGGGTAYGMRQRLVIRDAESWSAAWKKIVCQQQPAPAVPAIDFHREMVVLAAMGTKPDGGYAIAIDEVRKVDDDLSISIVEKSPASGCTVLAVLTAPVALIAMPRFDGDVEFVESSVTVPCR